MNNRTITNAGTKTAGKVKAELDALGNPKFPDEPAGASLTIRRTGRFFTNEHPHPLRERLSSIQIYSRFAWKAH